MPPKMDLPKATRIKVMTPPGKGYFMSLLEPDRKFVTPEKPFGSYKVTFVIPAEQAVPLQEAITKLRDEYLAAVVDKLKGSLRGRTPKLADLPFRPWQEPSGDGNFRPTGEVEFRFKMAEATGRPGKGAVAQHPLVIDANKKKLEMVSISMGSIIRVGGFAKPFYTPALGVGVSLGLEAVQLLKMAPRRTSTDLSDFDTVEGGFDISKVETVDSPRGDGDAPGDGELPADEQF